MKALRVAAVTLMACLALLGFTGLAAADPSPSPSPPIPATVLPPIGSTGADPCPGLQATVVQVAPKPIGVSNGMELHRFFDSAGTSIPAGRWIAVRSNSDNDIQLCGQPDPVAPSDTTIFWIGTAYGLGATVGIMILTVIIGLAFRRRRKPKTPATKTPSP